MSMINEYSVYPEGCLSCDDNIGLTIENVQEIIDDFEKHGFAVSTDAIVHNYQAWCRDEKSGYRDDKNDSFLFSPCGCNRLRFTASHLTGASWELTYSA